MPTVPYKVYTTDGDLVEIESPAQLPKPGLIDSIEDSLLDE